MNRVKGRRRSKLGFPRRLKWIFWSWAFAALPAASLVLVSFYAMDHWYIDDVLEATFELDGICTFFLMIIALVVMYIQMTFSKKNDDDDVPPETKKRIVWRMILNTFFIHLLILFGYFLKVLKDGMIDYSFPSDFSVISKAEKCGKAIMSASAIGIVVNTWLSNRLLYRKTSPVRFREWRLRKASERKLAKQYLEEMLTKCGVKECEYTFDRGIRKKTVRRSGLLKCGLFQKVNSHSLTEGTYDRHPFRTAKVALRRIFRKKEQCVGRFWTVNAPNDYGCEILLVSRGLANKLEKAGFMEQSSKQKTGRLQSFRPADGRLAENCFFYSDEPDKAQELLEYELGERIGRFLDAHPNQGFSVRVKGNELYFFEYERNGILADLPDRNLPVSYRSFRESVRKEEPLEDKELMEKRVIVNCVEQTRYELDRLNLLASEGESIMYNSVETIDVDEILQSYLKKAGAVTEAVPEAESIDEELSKAERKQEFLMQDF